MQKVHTKLPFLRRFSKDDEGSVAIEAILMFPLLMWAIVGTFVYYEGFRAKATSVKASYTVADMLSRELQCITEDYLDATQRMLNFLSSSHHQSNLRVTVAGFDADSNKYTKLWSEVRGPSGWSPHSGSSLNGESDRIPLLPPDDQLIIVETESLYEPLFKVANFGPTKLNNFVVVRPRAGQLYWCDDIL